MIRAIRQEDIPEIVRHGEVFFNESNQLGQAQFSQVRANHTLSHMLADDDYVMLMAEEDGQLAGFTFWGLENPWTEEKIGMEVIFYILPEYRKSSIARELLALSISMCKSKGASILYSSSTGGFGDNGINARAYNILLKRQGFTELPHSKFLVMELQ